MTRVICRCSSSDPFPARSSVLQDDSLIPLKLIVSNAGAALGQDRCYEQPSVRVQLPSVPYPAAAAGPGVRKLPLPVVEPSDRRFSGADFEIMGAQGEMSNGAGNSASSEGCAGQDGACEAASPESAESRAAQMLGSQAAAVEDIYRAMLARMEALAPSLTTDLAVFAQKKRAVADLQDMIR